MDSFFTRFRNPLVLITLVLLQILALAIQVQRPGQGFVTGDAADGHKVTLLRSWAAATVTPLERVTHATSLKTRGLWSNYIDLRNARQQNRELQDEVVRLRREQAEFAEDAAQGRRLQALLAFKQQYIAKTVAAQVIGTSGNDLSRILTIDKGAVDGLKPDQAVMTPDGIVGKIRDVFPHTSQLLLISDPSWGAGVMLASTRIRGILRGAPDGAVQINNLTADSRIKPGEKVVTSGGDQVFPRGLPVGVVESIAPDPKHQPYTAITIKPWSNLLRLEEVLIITETTPDLPPAAQGDAETAEATALENQRAADVLAEKLPSLQEESAAKPATGTAATPGAGAATSTPPAAPTDTTVGGLPGVPNSGMPKPHPAVHADRYSPGSAPSAEVLQPGAPAQPAQPKPSTPDAKPQD
jgi:rod shape-determining protein MreC